MRSSLFNIAVLSAITISQAAPIAPPTDFDMRQSIHQAEARAPIAPKTKLFFTEMAASSSSRSNSTGSKRRTAIPDNRDEEEDVSIFDITDSSGAGAPEIKHITVPKNFPNDSTATTTTTSTTSESSNVPVAERTSPTSTATENETAASGSSGEENGQEVLGSIAECGVDKAGRNYCRTSDGWFEYRCDTGEVHYTRHMPFADEEVCLDGSIA